MVDLFLLSRVQMRLIERYFPLSHGIARVDDRRIVSAIVFVIKNGLGLRWRAAARDYGPHKTIGSCAGAAWAYSTGFSPNWRARAASRSGS
jgi:transposase